MGFSLTENFDRTFVLSNLNFYANPYSSHSFQFPQKIGFDELYNFLKICASNFQIGVDFFLYDANVFSVWLFYDQPSDPPISYAFPFFVTASKTRHLLSFKNISKFNV